MFETGDLKCFVVLKDQFSNATYWVVQARDNDNFSILKLAFRVNLSISFATLPIKLSKLLRLVEMQ